MKTLILLRHAKSDWDAGARDFDRPINARGQRAARTIGLHLRESGIRWDHAIASPALRVVETLSEASKGYGDAIEPEWDRRAYLAPAALWLDLIHDAPAHADTLLLAGHNPGLEELALWLTTESELGDAVATKFPTAALAIIACDIDDWRAVTPGGGTLTAFVRPRDLDPALGPAD